MYPLFESIALIDGQLQRLSLHNQRLNHSRRQLLGCSGPLRLEEYLHVPAECRQGVYKCRVEYGAGFGPVRYTRYTPRILSALYLVNDNTIDYAHKYSCRRALEQHRLGLQPSEDILIVKNGYLTDTSYANCAFYDGHSWITPSTPLLPGTMRRYLLERSELKERPLKPADLQSFESMKLINALLHPDHSAPIAVEAIKPFRG